MPSSTRGPLATFPLPLFPCPYGIRPLPPGAVFSLPPLPPFLCRPSRSTISPLFVLPQLPPSLPANDFARFRSLAAPADPPEAHFRPFSFLRRARRPSRRTISPVFVPPQGPAPLPTNDFAPFRSPAAPGVPPGERFRPFSFFRSSRRPSRSTISPVFVLPQLPPSLPKNTFAPFRSPAGPGDEKLPAGWVGSNVSDGGKRLRGCSSTARGSFRAHLSSARRGPGSPRDWPWSRSC